MEVTVCMGMERIGAMIQLHQIVYFLNIAETQSMNKAAEELFVSQSNLSYAIKNLEDIVGKKLFERTNKGVFMTEDGKIFMQYAIKINEQLALIDSIKDISRKEHLMIASYPMVSMANIIAQFRNKIQKSEFEITVDEFRLEHVIEAVNSGMAEIGITQINMKQRKEVLRALKNNNLEYHPIKTGTWDIIVDKKHELADKKEVSIEELRNYPLIRARDDLYSGMSAHIETGGYRWGDFPKAIYANDGATRIKLLQKTDAFLTAATWAVEDYKEVGLVNLRLKDNNLVTELGWIKRKNEPLISISEIFVDILENYWDK